MDFISLDNVFLNNIADQRTVIFSASLPTFITKINVCNLSDDNSGIRVSLKQIKTLNIATPIEVFILRNLLFEKNITKNLIYFIGSNIFLNNGDSLIVYTAGYSQLIDCVADLYEHNEVISD